MHARMHMCTFLPNMLNIPQSERLWKQQKHINFASYLTIYLVRSHWWFFLGSYSQLLFLPFQLHSGGHFIIIIIDYCAPSRKSPEHLRRHKDTLISWQTHARPHTHYKYLHYWWWIGKTTSVCRGEEMGFHHFLHHQHHHLPSCQNREEEVGVWDVWRSCAA